MIDRLMIKMDFFETYYYANIISNILDDPFPYVRNLGEWMENNEENIFLASFPKFSRLHNFSYHILDSLFGEDFNDKNLSDVRSGKRSSPWISRALVYHGKKHCDFGEWMRSNDIRRSKLETDDLSYYMESFSDEIEEVMEQIVNEVFYVLFANRGLMATFNRFLADNFRDMFQPEDVNEQLPQLKRNGLLRRVHIPKWAVRAVFYRDRGICTSCHSDLSGLVSTQSASNIDHIIPLAKGGINDVTNLQLLCRDCNQSKSGNFATISNKYEAWYPMH